MLQEIRLCGRFSMGLAIVVGNLLSPPPKAPQSLEAGAEQTQVHEMVLSCVLRLPFLAAIREDVSLLASYLLGNIVFVVVVVVVLSASSFAHLALSRGFSSTN